MSEAPSRPCAKCAAPHEADQPCWPEPGSHAHAVAAGLPPVDPEVLDRAVEAGLEAAMDDPRWKYSEWPTGWAEVEHALRTAAPIIFDAGKEEARKAIEGLRIGAPAWPDDDSYEAGLDAALSLLTDKEGERLSPVTENKK